MELVKVHLSPSMKAHLTGTEKCPLDCNIADLILSNPVMEDLIQSNHYDGYSWLALAIPSCQSDHVQN